MDFYISGSDDWGNNTFSDTLHEQLFGNFNPDPNFSINIPNNKKTRAKKKHYPTEHELDDDTVGEKDVSPRKRNNIDKAVELASGETLPSVNISKKRKKRNQLNSALTLQVDISLPQNEKQQIKKLKLSQFEQNNVYRTKNEKFNESSREIQQKIPFGEQIFSEFPHTSKQRKEKRKNTEMLADSISNKQQKQGEICDSKNSALGKVKANRLNPSKLQEVFRKYNGHSAEAVQKVDDVKSRSSLLKENAMKNLQAAKFRFLNEKMYTVTGKEAMEYFKNDPDAFEEYHQGYQSQVMKWPINPADIIISDLQKMPKSSVVADLGCGDAKIARVLQNRTVHSFDLVALNQSVICCDISKVPLSNSSVDVAVFCLSLMGTNLSDYIIESHRILKDGGLLKIAEVESRIEDLDSFITKVEKYGFSLVSKDTKHKMFVFMDFKKVQRKMKLSKLPAIEMNPCMYKKR